VRRICFLIIIFVLFYCQSKKSGFLFRSDTEDLKVPEITFFYGKLGDKTNQSDTYFETVGERFCIFSLPKILFELEEGFKLKICFRIAQSELKIWELGFLELNSWEEPRYRWNHSGAGFIAEITNLSEWQKKTKSNKLKHSFVNRKWSDGTIAFFTNTVPHVEIYEWEEGGCEFLFPSRITEDSASKKKFIRVQTSCPDLETLILEVKNQNEYWREICPKKANALELSESFRSGDLTLSRFIELRNTSNECIHRTPGFHFGFVGDSSSFEEDTKRIESLDAETEIILPNAHLLFVDEAFLFGFQVSKGILSSIGKSGSFIFGDDSYVEKEFSFRHDNEYFSNSEKADSCRNTYQFYKNKQVFCGSPGITNLIFDIAMDRNEVPSCHPNQIHITEYYNSKGQVGENFDPSFFEFQNTGESCDLSGLNFEIGGSVFPASAVEFLIDKGEVFLLTKENWIGWNFKYKTIPLSIPPTYDAIPNFSWKDRRTKMVAPFFDVKQHNNRLSNLNGKPSSLLYDTNWGSLPFPYDASKSNPNLPFFGSPGTFDLVPSQWIGGNLAEVLLYGFGSNQNPYRFFEFQFDPGEEGYFRYRVNLGLPSIFWKEKGSRFEVIVSRFSECFGSKQILGWDIWEPNQNSFHLEFGTNQQFLLDENTFNTIGDDIVKAIHPDIQPFGYSVEKNHSTICPQYRIQPGQMKTKEIRILRSKMAFETLYELNEGRAFDAKIQIGNLRKKIAPSIHTANYHQISVDPNSYESHFFPDEILYSYIHFPLDSIPFGFLERKPELSIEAVYPNPINGQNEWIYVCNRSNTTVSLENIFIEDENSIDYLIPYQSRFPNRTPKGKNNESFSGPSWELNSQSCFWLVDPDGDSWYLPLFHKDSDLIFTVVSTQTIGNGISSGEKLNLKKTKNGQNVLISSFGHNESSFSFSILVNSGEYIWLKPGMVGEKKSDYSIFRESE